MNRYTAIALLLLTTGCVEASGPVAPTVERNDWSVAEDSEEEPKPSRDVAPTPAPDISTGVPQKPAAPKADKSEAPDDRNFAEFTADVVDLVNQVRATGADCGEQGVMEPAPPMVENPRLRAAADKHSGDMAAHDFLAHEGSDGNRFWDRVAEEGYQGTARGENVAAGYPTPEEVVEGWLDSDGHCLIVMLPETNEIGVGHRFADDTTYGHFWTMNTGIR